jgi:hypothetical protein
MSDSVRPYRIEIPQADVEYLAADLRAFFGPLR